MFSLALTDITGGFYHPHFAGVETGSGRDKVTYSRWGLNTGVLPLQFKLLPVHHARFLAGLVTFNVLKTM